MPFWKKDKPIRDADLSALSPPIRDAYERGRKDERESRRRHPLIMSGLVVLAAAGASLITLAAVTGSFGDGGQVADQRIAQAADSAAPVIDQAVDKTQTAARDAGAAIQDRTRSVLKGSK